MIKHQQILSRFRKTNAGNGPVQIIELSSDVSFIGFYQDGIVSHLVKNQGNHVMPAGNPPGKEINKQIQKLTANRTQRNCVNIFYKEI